MAQSVNQWIMTMMVITIDYDDNDCQCWWGYTINATRSKTSHGDSRSTAVAYLTFLLFFFKAFFCYSLVHAKDDADAVQVPKKRRLPKAPPRPEALLLLTLMFYFFLLVAVVYPTAKTVYVLLLFTMVGGKVWCRCC